MLFSEFRVRHDAIRGEAKSLQRETLVKDLLQSCASDAERVAACELLLAKPGAPAESLTTGIKETWLANHLGLSTRSLLDIRQALPAMWAKQDHVGAGPSLEAFHAALATHGRSTDRSDAAKGQLVAQAMAMPAWEDAFLALEILTGKLSNKLDDLTLFYAVSRLQPDCPFAKSWKAADKARLSRAFNTNPNLADWVGAWHGQSFWTVIDATRPRVGVPGRPQLADQGKDLAEVFAQPRDLVWEPKLDGVRVHAHIDAGGKVRLFSRALNEITDEHPDLCTSLASAPHLRDSILDGELVALDGSGNILPFAYTKRKDDDAVARKAITLYDAWRVNGNDLFNTPLHLRRSAFTAVTHGVQALSTIPQEALRDLAHLEGLVEACHANGEEGVVVKDLAAVVLPGDRDPCWVKAKALYSDKLSDTVDVVVVGYNRGRGKRHGLVGSLWIAVREDGVLHPVSKLGTGFSDEDLDAWTKRLAGDVLTAPASNVVPGRIGSDVEVWVEPTIVIEVNAAEVSRSPHYSAGAGPDGRGLSLRFPVMLRERTDKTPSAATTVQDLLNMERRTAEPRQA